MEYSENEIKKRRVLTWIRMLRKSESEVIISDYSYKCLLSGIPTTKTLIVIPDEIESRGIIAINKPMSQVEVTDIIKIYSRIK